VSHRDWEEFAYDFAMPVGSEVCAARGGSVVLVEMGHDGNGFGLPNNQIAVAHDDGSVGYYLHLKQCGNLVNIGDRVEQGQCIAVSGHVGLSMLPHLHFHVIGAGGQLLPVTFAEVGGDGIPRMFGRYTSDNAPPP
jgi:murein DD-endopeptidase MepM/ murein hydrolase activator NlpD